MRKQNKQQCIENLKIFRMSLVNDILYIYNPVIALLFFAKKPPCGGVRNRMAPCRSRSVFG